MKKLIYISLISLLLGSCSKQNPLLPKVNSFGTEANEGGNTSDDSDGGITDPDKDDDYDSDGNIIIERDNNESGITDPDKDDDYDSDGNIIISKEKTGGKGDITDPDKDDDRDIDVGSGKANAE